MTPLRYSRSFTNVNFCFSGPPKCFTNFQNFKSRLSHFIGYSLGVPCFPIPCLYPSSYAPSKYSILSSSRSTRMHIVACLDFHFHQTLTWKCKWVFSSVWPPYFIYLLQRASLGLGCHEPSGHIFKESADSFIESRCSSVFCNYIVPFPCNFF